MRAVGPRHLRVLCHEDGQPLTPKVVQRMMDRVKRRAMLEEPGSVHILRHTFCSHLAMRGAPIRAVQELARHSDIATTVRYMHLSPASLEAAVRLLDEQRDQVAEATARGDILETAGAENKKVSN